MFAKFPFIRVKEVKRSFSLCSRKLRSLRSLRS